jgi:hypothetical protein
LWQVRLDRQDGYTHTVAKHPHTLTAHFTVGPLATPVRLQAKTGHRSRFRSFELVTEVPALYSLPMDDLLHVFAQSSDGDVDSEPLAWDKTTGNRSVRAGWCKARWVRTGAPGWDDIGHWLVLAGLETDESKGYEAPPLASRDVAARGIAAAPLPSADFGPAQAKEQERLLNTIWGPHPSDVLWDLVEDFMDAERVRQNLDMPLPVGNKAGGGTVAGVSEALATLVAAEDNVDVAQANLAAINKRAQAEAELYKLPFELTERLDPDVLLHADSTAVDERCMRWLVLEKLRLQHRFGDVFAEMVHQLEAVHGKHRWLDANDGYRNQGLAVPSSSAAAAGTGGGGASSGSSASSSSSSSSSSSAGTSKARSAAAEAASEEGAKEGKPAPVATAAVDDVGADAVPPPPQCSNGHDMCVSSYKGGAYTGGWRCDRCSGGGSVDRPVLRWFCKACSSDICFGCSPAPPRAASDGEDIVVVTQGEEDEGADEAADTQVYQAEVNMLDSVRTGAMDNLDPPGERYRVTLHGQDQGHFQYQAVGGDGFVGGGGWTSIENFSELNFIGPPGVPLLEIHADASYGSRHTYTRRLFMTLVVENELAALTWRRALTRCAMEKEYFHAERVANADAEYMQREGCGWEGAPVRSWEECEPELLEEDETAAAAAAASASYVAPPQFAVLHNGTGSAAQHNGKVAIYLDREGSYETTFAGVRVLDARSGVPSVEVISWPREHCEMCADPRSDDELLFYAFMQACHDAGARRRGEPQRLYKKMGSPSLYRKTCILPWCHQACTPLDAVVLSLNQEMMGLEDDNSEVIALLQGAGAALSPFTIAYCNGPVDIAAIARQGLDLGGFDTTLDMGVDYGNGADTSLTACVFEADYATEAGEPAPGSCDDLLALLEAGATAWPFHLPGVTPDTPPAGYKPLGEDEVGWRHDECSVMARVCWPHVFGQGAGGGGFVAVPAAFFEQAVATCSAVKAAREVGRKEGNWARRRLVLLCLLASDKPAEVKKRRSRRGVNEALLQMIELQKGHFEINRLILSFV